MITLDAILFVIGIVLLACCLMLLVVGCLILWLLRKGRIPPCPHHEEHATYLEPKDLTEL